MVALLGGGLASGSRRGSRSRRRAGSRTRESPRRGGMAGVAFAGVLVSIVRSGQVQAMLTDLVQKALTVA
ncbi:uncharacterized protein DUF4244 [Frondihabitans sp. PhB153]|nr:uncharacterized protein DUF4244 [Frondihabitans sp. PhB153]